MTTELQELTSSQSSPEMPVNENFETLSAIAVFGKRHPATTALTWGYYGGRFNGNTIADGTVALTNNSANYVVALRSTGAVSVSTGTTNWDSALSARLYKVTTASGVVSAVEDHRMNSNGLLLGTPVAGRHAIYIAAAAMQPSVSGGCAALATVAISAGQPDICVLDFDASTDESAQFSIVMPKSWNEGTITAKFHWTHAAAASFAVVWGIQAVAVSNDDTIGVSFGTAVTVTDTGGTTIDKYDSDETAAMTVAGTPAAEDLVFFKVYRDADAGGDTLNVDARLLGVTLYITTDAGTDA